MIRREVEDNYKNIKNTNWYYEEYIWTTSDMDEWTAKYYRLGWWKGLAVASMLWGWVMVAISLLVK